MPKPVYQMHTLDKICEQDCGKVHDMLQWCRIYTQLYAECTDRSYYIEASSGYDAISWQLTSWHVNNGNTSQLSSSLDILSLILQSMLSKCEFCKETVGYGDNNGKGSTYDAICQFKSETQPVETCMPTTVWNTLNIDRLYQHVTIIFLLSPSSQDKKASYLTTLNDATS